MGETALHIAAQYNDGAMIQALLASHANLEELTVDSRSGSAFGSHRGWGVKSGTSVLPTGRDS